MIYFPWLYSDEYLTTLKEPEPYQTALMAFGTGWSKSWDAKRTDHPLSRLAQS